MNGDNLTGWNFANQNLTNASFSEVLLRFSNVSETVYANLTSANFTNANLTGAYFFDSTLTNANFTDADLSDARIAGRLTNTNFTGADLRGATSWSPTATTVTHNTIRPDGSIQGLALQAGEKLVIRNNSIPITVTTSATMDPTATLQFLLEGNWTSPIGFSPGLIPMLGGTLDLEFANGVDPTGLLGQSFQLFNWNGPLPAGDQFGAITTEPGFMFDTSDLYTTGYVTLTAVPEPSSLLLVGLAGVAMLRRFARKRSR